jgi:hypothetical protein
MTTGRGSRRLRNTMVAADAINEVWAPDTADRWLSPEIFMASSTV